MAPALGDLAAPDRTAIITQECQNAIVGPDAGFQVLAAEARREAIPNIARLLPVARAAGVRIVHCTVVRRADGLGSNHNAPLFAVGAKLGGPILPGSAGAQVVPELAPAESDLVLARSTGIGPMGGTDLDSVLRNLGVSTVVGVGVSVNFAIMSLAMDAVNAGYHAVIPRDAVAAFPREYADSVIDLTLSAIATVTTTDELVRLWS
jgi:nicotinamidase-related amidase